MRRGSAYMKPGSKSFFRLVKPLVFGLCLLPLLLLTLRAFELGSLGLGANPVEELLHQLGRWGLKFLLITLSITPLRRWTGWNWLIRFRRMLGLFAFFYVVLHFITYAVLDQGLELALIVEDIVKRPYITLGVAASPGIPGCHPRCLAFLLAGKAGYIGRTYIRPGTGRVAGHAAERLERVSQALLTGVFRNPPVMAFVVLQPSDTMLRPVS